MISISPLLGLKGWVRIDFQVKTRRRLLTNWDRSSSYKGLVSMFVVTLIGDHSQSGPHATGTARHMGNIEDDQGMSILYLACQTDTVAPSPGSDICVIDTPSDLAIADVVQILGVGSGLINMHFTPLLLASGMARLGVAVYSVRDDYSVDNFLNMFNFDTVRSLNRTDQALAKASGSVR